MSVLGDTNNNILTVAYHCAEQAFPISDSDKWLVPAPLSDLNCIYVEATCDAAQFTTCFSVLSGETYIIRDPDKLGSSNIKFYFQRDRSDQHGYIEWRELGGGSHQFYVVVGNAPYFDQGRRDIDLVLQQNDTWPTFPYTFNSTRQGYEISLDASAGNSGILQSSYWLPLRLHAITEEGSQTNRYLYWDFNNGSYGTKTERMFTINNVYGQLYLKPETNFWPDNTRKMLYGDMWVAICPHVSAAPGQLLLLGHDALQQTGQSKLYTIQRNYQFDTEKHITCMPDSVYVNDNGANVGYDFIAANETDHGFYSKGYGSATTRDTPTKNGFAAPTPVWGGEAKKGVLATPYNQFLVDGQSDYMLGPATASTSAAYLKASNMRPMYVHASSNGSGKVLWTMPTNTSGARNPLVADSDLTVYTYCTKDIVVGINNQLYMLFAYNDSNNINSFVSTAPTLQNAICAAVNASNRVDTLFINGQYYAITRTSSSQTWATQLDKSVTDLYCLIGYGVVLTSQNVGQRSLVKINNAVLYDSEGQAVYTDQTIVNGGYYHTS